MAAKGISQGVSRPLAQSGLSVTRWNVDRRVAPGHWENIKHFQDRATAEDLARLLGRGGQKFRVRPVIPKLPPETVGSIEWKTGAFCAMRYCKELARMRQVARCQDINDALRALPNAEKAWAAEDARNGYRIVLG
jgi:hypothetical protein